MKLQTGQQALVALGRRIAEEEGREKVPWEELHCE